MDQFNLDMKLAFCYFKEMQREEGNRIFEAAFKKMDQTEPSKKRAGGLFEIAELYRQNGLESRAMFLYSSVARMFCDSKQEVSASNVAVINKCLNGMMQNDEQLKDGTPGKEKNIEIFRGILQKISELKDKHPNMPEAISLGFYYLARCYSQRSDGKKSSHYNKRAVQVMQSAHPDSYKKFYMVGYCMHNLAANQEKIGLHHEAMQYFQKAIEYLEV
uniref:Rapsyn myristoylation/linker region N-terminal domain-containing protein n=1 Tax=Ciona savignyi TaxID=51511 RepID=H2ZE71_CIOSA